MVFSSHVFLFWFLPITLLAYFSRKSPKSRLRVLLIASLFFYAWGEPLFVATMLFSIVANRWGALWIDADTGSGRRGKTSALVLMNVLLLVLFKYATFFLETLEILLGLELSITAFARRVPLPLGVSFYTFQCISYLIDVHRNRIPAERDLTTLGSYIAMFPQLVAGPIVRYASIRDEMLQCNVRLDRIVRGAQLFTIGLAFKVLLADSFAVTADYVFARTPTHMSAAFAWTGLVAYTFQIYFDFNGYSVMAIGLGCMLGFTFPGNFSTPYLSRNVTDFWRRWHISLSSWFRDYVYISMGGNRLGERRTYVNLMLVFVLCGLWHGAAWTFIVWGLWHGLLLIVERNLRGRSLGRSAPLGVIYTMLVVMIGWVFFRSSDMGYATAFLGALFNVQQAVVFQFAELGPLLLVPLALVGAFCSAWNINHRDPPVAPWRPVTLMLYLSLFLSSVVAMTVGTHKPFIYFRF